jgi:hypothetical protein
MPTANEDNPICAVCYIAPTQWPAEELYRRLCFDINVVFNANGVVHGTMRAKGIQPLLERMQPLLDIYGGKFTIIHPKGNFTLYRRAHGKPTSVGD